MLAFASFAPGSAIAQERGGLDGYEAASPQPIPQPASPRQSTPSPDESWPHRVEAHFPARADERPSPARPGLPLWLQLGGGFAIGSGAQDELANGGYLEGSITLAFFEPLPSGNSGFGYEIGLSVLGIWLPEAEAAPIGTCVPRASTTLGAVLVRNALLISAGSLDVGIGAAFGSAPRRDCGSSYLDPGTDSDDGGLSLAVSAALELSPFVARTVAIRPELFVTYSGGIVFVAGLFGLSVRL
jgi:hypothetical protein